MSPDSAQEANALADRIGRLSCESVDKPVLVYFDIIGICWPIRCLLHLKDIDYERLTISLGAWIHRNPDGCEPLIECCRNGHLPVYVDSDVHMSQSNLIMAYLAEKHDLFGDNAEERRMINEIMAHAYDALFHWSGLFQIIIKLAIPDAVAESRLRAFMGNGMWGVLSDGYRRNLDPFERYLRANPDKDSGFIVGSRLSIADLHAFNVLCNWYKAFDRARFVQSHPRLDRYIRGIAALPRVGDYIRHRQEPTTWFPWPEAALRLTSPEELIGLTD